MWNVKVKFIVIVSEFFGREFSKETDVLVEKIFFGFIFIVDVKVKILDSIIVKYEYDLEWVIDEVCVDVLVDICDVKIFKSFIEE